MHAHGAGYGSCTASYSLAPHSDALAPMRGTLWPMTSCPPTSTITYSPRQAVATGAIAEVAVARATVSERISGSLPS